VRHAWAEDFSVAVDTVNTIVKHGLSWIALLSLSALLLLAGCGPEINSKAPQARPVRTVIAEKSVVDDLVEMTGHIQSERETTLSFRIGGRIIERSVGAGDNVRPGQVLAKLDPQNEQNGVRSAQARLVAAQGHLREARNNLARERALLARRYTTQILFDRAQTAVQTAQSEIEDAQARLKIAQDQLSYTELKATAAGAITARGAEAGEVVQPGQMIYQLAQQGGWDAVFDVPARLLRAAPRDPNVTLALTDDPKVTTTGRVRQVDPQADPITRTFRVRVGIVNPPGAMRLGATVVGRLRLNPAHAISIPATALTEIDGRPSVWIVDPPSSTVSMRRIEILRFDPATVVVSDGLRVGDIVVTAGVQALHPGQKVRLLGARS
jgi:membrane fusion protein, multidrug efflux system